MRVPLLLIAGVLHQDVGARVGAVGASVKTAFTMYNMVSGMIISSIATVISFFATSHAVMISRRKVALSASNANSSLETR